MGCGFYGGSGRKGKPDVALLQGKGVQPAINNSVGHAPGHDEGGAAAGAAAPGAGGVPGQVVADHQVGRLPVEVSAAPEVPLDLLPVDVVREDVLVDDPVEEAVPADGGAGALVLPGRVASDLVAGARPQIQDVE